MKIFITLKQTKKNYFWHLFSIFYIILLSYLFVALTYMFSEQLAISEILCRLII